MIRCKEEKKIEVHSGKNQMKSINNQNPILHTSIPARTVHTENSTWFVRFFIFKKIYILKSSSNKSVNLFFSFCRCCRFFVSSVERQHCCCMHNLLVLRMGEKLTIIHGMVFYGTAVTWVLLCIACAFFLFFHRVYKMYDKNIYQPHIVIRHQQSHPNIYVGARE